MTTVMEALQAGLRHHQAGRLQDAEEIYRQVLQMEPRQADALHLLGVAVQQTGRHDEAVRLLRDAIALRPAQPLFRCSLANALAALKQFDLALSECKEALRLQPDFAEAYASLGDIFRLGGRMADAEAAFRAVIRLRPDNSEAHNNLGNVLKGQGDLDAAEACYREALRLRPAEPVALANLGAVLVLTNRLDEAEQCLRPAIQLCPDLAPAHASLGDLLLKRGRLEEAEVSYRNASRITPLNPETHAILGKILRQSGDIPAARSAYAEAVRLQPASPEYRNDLATCLIEEGQVTEAVTHLQEALRLSSAYVPALGNLGTLARDGMYAFRAEDVAQVRTLLADPALSAEARCTLAFALAHALARQQSYDEAFSFYRQANDTRSALFRARGQSFDRVQHQRFIDEVIAVGTPELFQRAKEIGSNSELPVFIVGMPRSGTTLVEQILASHPMVYGAGELPDIPKLGAALAQSRGALYPACLPGLDPAIVAAVADSHLKRLVALGGSATRVIDKLPANVFHLPLIRLLFPQARIIHCIRDPLDVCLSCYFQDFYTLSFATDLEDIGFYYRAYECVVEHWRSIQPAPMMEVRYEALVDDVESMSRAMIHFCGLPWDDCCLAFHKSQRVVRTSSVAQVRNPIYRDSLGRWQSYRDHLAPLFRALGRNRSCENV